MTVADIDVMVQQRGPKPAGECHTLDLGEHEPARKPDVMSTPKVAPASASKPAAAAPEAAADAKLPTSTAAEPRAESWKFRALSLTVTVTVAFTLCVIVNVLSPRFGLLAAPAPASPLPISGSPLAYLTGFALFTAAGSGVWRSSWHRMKFLKQETALMMTSWNRMPGQR